MLTETDSEYMSVDFQQYNRGPRKSILKLPDRSPTRDRRKSAHWDENNLQNYLYARNDGNGLIDGEQTKASSDWESNGDLNEQCMSGREVGDGTDGNVFAEQKLRQEIQIYQENALKKKAFEEKRKAHYNEFKSLQAAKDLMKHYEEEEEEDTEPECTTKDYSHERCQEKAEKIKLLPEEWERKRPKIEKIHNTT